MSQVVSVNLGQAQKSFRDLASNTDGSDEKLIEILNTMPQLKEELRTLAEANGLATDDTTLLGLAFGGTTGSAKILKDQFDNTAAATLDTTGKIQNLANAVRGFTDDAISSERAAIRFEEKMNDVTEAVENNSEAGFDNTEGGLRNRTAVLDAAEALNNMTVANYENGGSVAELRSDLNEQREELIEIATQFLGSRDKAKEYIDTLVMTPEQLNTLVTTTGTPESKEEIAGVQTALDVLAGRGTPRIYAPMLSAGKDTAGLAWWDETRAQFMQGYNVQYNVSGNGPPWMVQQENGGVQEYANGGFASGIYKGQVGNLYKLAQPEFGWEAFISGKPSQRQRNIEIWQSVGARLGMGMLPSAVGQIYSSMSEISGPSGTSSMNPQGNIASMSKNYNNIVITVNPAEKMDKSELSSSISKEISFQMRRGSVT